MKIIKLDFACNDPKKTAKCYSLLVGKNVKDLGDSCFEINLDGETLFFCSKEMAGTPNNSTGIHQLHLQTNKSYDEIIKIAESNNLKHELVAYGPSPSLCIWDVEQNPIIFSN